MSQRNRANKKSERQRSASAGPIAFFVALFIVALGAIQLISTFHTYALDLADLNALKKEEASLTAQKQELENDISRWNDQAYVVAQARERLGFVFEGETLVNVEHPEAVTGEGTTGDDSSSSSSETTLPWYNELAYSMREADKEPASTSSDSSDSSSSSATSSPSSSASPSVTDSSDSSQ
ncbi:FtsB family cell division protein [Bifidobacterium choloepi]|uniref:Septum formation initiator family protein n=1 Tax=Bifidobacterium choloepi TaxID=2614131 RepID=A0A6I5MYQ1_9BIFI|nr:septum formation initiator family protein [Bifidobacterium choloepi]NEG69326.1 septum formation initiator family protein [Bifidobacterium choloepi]